MLLDGWNAGEFVPKNMYSTAVYEDLPCASPSRDCHTPGVNFAASPFFDGRKTRQEGVRAGVSRGRLRRCMEVSGGVDVLPYQFGFMVLRLAEFLLTRNRKALSNRDRLSAESSSRNLDIAKRCKQKTSAHFVTIGGTVCSKSAVNHPSFSLFGTSVHYCCRPK